MAIGSDNLISEKYSFRTLFRAALLLMCIIPLGGLTTAQDDDNWREEALNALYGFDSVNGRNSDWQPFTHTFEHGIEMVLVPSGMFEMGSSEEEVETAYQQCLLDNETCNRQAYEIEMPRHPQTIQNPFWIGKYEVSRSQYDECVSRSICTAVQPSPASTQPNDPINQVTWLQALSFCEQWNLGHLPTELEWEYAARGPSSWTYPWGNEFEQSNLNLCDSNCEQDWRTDSDDGYTYTAPVDAFSDGASWVGAYNLSGNVWEWVSTKFRGYPYQSNDRYESRTGSDLRIIRGGSFQANITLIRTHTRFWFDPTVVGSGIGFRCARDFDKDNL